MWRVVVAEDGAAPLPAIDVAEDAFVVGGGADARVRLPAGAEQVRVAGGRWAMGEAGGDVGDGVELVIGTYRVWIAPAPAGAVATPPQRTESLARELMRGIMGDAGVPTLEVERGPIVGARRRLAPPESVLAIGRGDDAGWAIADEDLSRLHAEVRRTWDGIRVVDLGSRNGTRVDGARVKEGGAGVVLRDGSLLELGNVAMRFRDPASPRAEPVATPSPSPSPSLSPSPSSSPSWIFYVALAVMSAAIGAAVWLLVS